MWWHRQSPFLQGPISGVSPPTACRLPSGSKGPEIPAALQLWLSTNNFDGSHAPPGGTCSYGHRRQRIQQALSANAAYNTCCVLRPNDAAALVLDNWLLGKQAFTAAAAQAGGLWDCQGCKMGLTTTSWDRSQGSPCLLIAAAAIMKALVRGRIWRFATQHSLAVSQTSCLPCICLSFGSCLLRLSFLRSPPRCKQGVLSGQRLQDHCCAAYSMWLACC